MSRKLERRVALLEEGQLEEYNVERERSRNIAASVYKGRVKNIEPGLKAMFVDIGLKRMPFSIFGMRFLRLSTAGLKKSNGPDQEAAEKAPDGQGHSERLSDRLRSHRPGNEGTDWNKRPAGFDQSEFCRSLPRA